MNLRNNPYNPFIEAVAKAQCFLWKTNPQIKKISWSGLNPRRPGQLGILSLNDERFLSPLYYVKEETFTQSFNLITEHKNFKAFLVEQDLTTEQLYYFLASVLITGKLVAFNHPKSYELYLAVVKEAYTRARIQK